jgi:hypothetical protein
MRRGARELEVLEMFDDEDELEESSPEATSGNIRSSDGLSDELLPSDRRGGGLSGSVEDERGTREGSVL